MLIVTLAFLRRRDLALYRSLGMSGSHVGLSLVIDYVVVSLMPATWVIAGVMVASRAGGVRAPAVVLMILDCARGQMLTIPALALTFLWTVRRSIVDSLKD